jgi:hypothetical protein
MFFAFAPAVWGPPYWFFLFTVALTYPLHPNDASKKKYYDLVQNLPLFLPVADIGNQFSVLLDKYPVTPYLDSRPSFIKWVHFIHNKVNVSLRKPEQSLADSLQAYYALYKPKAVASVEERRRREKLIFLGLLFCLFLASLVIYHKEKIFSPYNTN